MIVKYEVEKLDVFHGLILLKEETDEYLDNNEIVKEVASFIVKHPYAKVLEYTEERIQLCDRRTLNKDITDIWHTLTIEGF